MNSIFQTKDRTNQKKNLKKKMNKKKEEKNDMFSYFRATQTTKIV